MCFLHQDTYFLKETSLENMCAWVLRLNKMETIGIIGVAGASMEKDSHIYSSILQRSRAERYGDTCVRSERKVQTLDECLFIIPKYKIMECGFDRNLKEFHLYYVEHCLRMNKYKESCVVIPVKIWHISSGSHFRLDVL